MICPFCSVENLDGVDDCAGCGQPLSDAHLPEPSTEVERCLLMDRVEVLNPKVPIAVSPDTTVRDVLRLLVDRRIGCVIVADAGKPVGIFTERDALQKLSTNAVSLGDQPVSAFMTGTPDTLDGDAKVAFAVQRMDVGGYRHLPIVSDTGKLTGIISVRDILRYLAEKLTA
jgi:CBS domain-containing protein